MAEDPPRGGWRNELFEAMLREEYWIKFGAGWRYEQGSPPPALPVWRMSQQAWKRQSEGQQPAFRRSPYREDGLFSREDYLHAIQLFSKDPDEDTKKLEGVLAGAP